MKTIRFLFLIAGLLLSAVIFFPLHPGGERPRDLIGSGNYESDVSPAIPSTESVAETGPDTGNSRDDLIARALSADANDLSATESQRRAFAALQKRLAAPTRDSLLESAKRDPAAYHFSNAANGGKSVRNPIHGFAATFEAAGGIEVRPGNGANWNWRMEMLDLSEAGPLSSEAATVERRRGPGMTEWYVNEARGLEQFFTLEDPIATNSAGESRIRIRMETDLVAERADRDRIEFRDASGTPVLHYHGLEVIDADGASLPSRMELDDAATGEEIVVALVFDARDAAFPVTVDPFVSTVLHRFPENDGSNPGEFTLVTGSTFVFSADDGVHGEELWKSDGTAAGTVMIKDIDPGDGSSSPQSFTLAGSTVFFSADDGETGRELWKTDLTEAGTERITDLYAGNTDGVSKSQGAFNIVNNRILFVADDGSSGKELWSSNGTEAGTGLVKDINPGSDSSSPSQFALLNGELFFRAEDAATGVELWKSDGTLGGTVQVADVYDVGIHSSWPTYLTVFNGALYFRATTGAGGYELWKSDGIPGGTTVQLKDIQVGTGNSSPSLFTLFDGALFFVANDGVNGSELWKTDGTDTGTVLFKDINTGAVGATPQELTVAGSTLFFEATDALHGRELWKSDGTDIGTVLVADINPGTENSNPEDLFASGSAIYFAADNGSTGKELWMSDGTGIGTVLVKEIDTRLEPDGTPYRGNPGRFFAFGGITFFAAADENGTELWQTDGTGAGTMRLKDIDQSGNLEGDPVKSGDRIFFVYEDSDNGCDLWVTDGTPGGTLLLRPSGDDDTLEPEDLTDVAGILYFNGYDDNHGEELWKSNGTVAGTVLVKDIEVGENGSNPEYLTAVGDTLFFRAYDGTNGEELWKSDGTAGSTVMVKDIRPGASSANPKELADLDGVVLFEANDGISGNELWKSDGTEAGTVLVKDIVSGEDGSSIDNGIVVSDLGLYFFSADDSTHGTELWKSDGTEAGTQLVKDIEPGPDSSDPEQLTDAGVLYFEAFTSGAGRELWVSDGTDDGMLDGPIGTEMVADINPGPADSNLAQLTSFTPEPADPNDPEITGVLFLADDGTTGLELWVAAAQMSLMAGQIVDLNPGSGSGFDSEAPLIYSGQRLFFPGNVGDGVAGTELYSPPPEGAPGVPELHEDLNPGGDGSHPTGLIELNGQLIWFAADDQGGYTLRSKPGDVLPDSKIGKNIGTLKGNDIYNTSASGQKQTLVSKKLKKLKFHGRIENDGNVADRVSMTGTKGTKKIKIKYFGPTGNVTGQVTGAGYQLTVPPGDSKIFRVEMKPKRKLKIKKTGKIKRKTKTANLTSKSLIDSAMSDKIQCKGKTR